MSRYTTAIFNLIKRHQPKSTLFPYTTLFRSNRPHIKTHKNPMLAQLQIKAGAKGITCQKLGEAEIMADSGIDDILISYNLLDRKSTRLNSSHVRISYAVFCLKKKKPILGGYH